MADLKITNYQERVEFAKREHDVLDFWDAAKIFERSVEERPEDKRYVFYDGPPFATGLPHYGHILTSVIKDAVPRYWTMKGYRVDRVWGWDCHGIPIENMIEKELGLKGGKKGIEELGVDKFNAACRAAILRFDKEWEKVIRRIGRWVDFKNSYKTMDKTFMESVWWAFKELNTKGMVYEGRKVILYCPRCATPLSNFEIAMDNSYKEVEDNSVYAMFRIVGKAKEYLLAWTTTPWTLIGNVALAVDANAEYIKVRVHDVSYWLAKSRASAILKGEDWEQNVEEAKTGKELVGIEYEPLYSYMPLEGKKAHYVTDASFVSLEEGTGIVHTAAIYGEDDYKLAQEKQLPCVPTLDDQGKFLPFVEPIAGVFYKKAESWVIEDLEKRDLLYKAEKIVHSYPFCYRCETPLYYNAVPAWFINIQKMKKDLLAQNEHINWYPPHLKHGRFGNGLETAPDWNISRSRYWGTPMPIWQSEDKKQFRIVGSIEELKQWAVDPQKVAALTDIHREFLDDIEVYIDDAKTIKGKRLPEVFDCWVESGSMPYASLHYPFEHKELFEATHPAQFIVEYISQTRAWFYTLHVMSVGLFGTHTFENALTHGVILAEDGAKMSKSKKNYPDPSLLIEQYGSDALRFYLMASVVMKAENVNFSEHDVKQVSQNLINIVWNVFAFYKLYVPNGTSVLPDKLSHVLDQWIVSKTQDLVSGVTTAMDEYDTVVACRLIQEFVTDLSTWYVRRSRERVRTNTEAQSVMGWVLSQVMLVLAPFVPFVSELMYQNMGTKTVDSVHLLSWPQVNLSLVNTELEADMDSARKIVEVVHALRKTHSIAVRQPLATWTATNKDGVVLSHNPGVLAVISEEVNVVAHELDTAKVTELTKKEGVYSATFVDKKLGEVTVYVDMVLTEELKRAGMVRTLVRSIQVLRKEKGCTMDEHIKITLPDTYKILTVEDIARVKKEALVDEVTWGNSLTLLTG